MLGLDVSLVCVLFEIIGVIWRACASDTSCAFNIADFGEIGEMRSKTD